MLPKCLLVLFLINFIDVGFSYAESYRPCPYPSLEHGRVRLKQRNRLVRYMCLLHYELVGDRYATCRNGHWDSPTPVCVRPGCAPINVSPNALTLKEHQGAWVVTFCLPGFKLEGSTAVYCDGHTWNDTAPRCVETTVNSSLSCDFEDPGICGWTQDELHDFDWKRWNEKTPSNFILTGPSYDHTYGKDKLGYYMYIESSAKAANMTARLLSPVYDSSLSTDGCFQFFYHMYGKDMGGLRVYQKPIDVQLVDMLRLSDAEQKYLLFKVWGNQGNDWYSEAPQLKPMEVDFQIVIEGVRGASFISDIAIDDVSLLRGDACLSAKLGASTPPSTPPQEYLQSCAGRCGQAPAHDSACGCNIQCLLYRNCCPDFLEICFSEEPDQVYTSTETLPEVQKLVGETTTTQTSTTTTTTLKRTTTSTTTAKPTTTSTTTAKPTTTSTTTAKPTTTKPTTTKPTTTKPTTTKPTTTKSTTTKPTTTKSTTKPTTTKPTTTKSTTKPTTVLSPEEITLKFTTQVHNITDDSIIDKEKAETEVNLNKMVTESSKTGKKSSTWKTAVVIIVLLALFLSLVYLGVTARTARGRQALARLRGRTSQDSEVRYLNSADDDDL